MAEPSGEHLRAIIETQTKIAASGLDLDAAMQLIAGRAGAGRGERQRD